MDGFLDLLDMAASIADDTPYHRGDPLYVVYSGLVSRYTNLLHAHRSPRRAVKWCTDRLYHRHGYLSALEPGEDLWFGADRVEIYGPVDFTVVQCAAPEQVSAGLSKALTSRDSMVDEVHVLYDRDGLKVWNLCINREEALGFRRQYSPHYHENGLVRKLPFFDW